MQSVEEDSNRDSIQSPGICFCELLPPRRRNETLGEEGVVTKEREKKGGGGGIIPRTLKRQFSLTNIFSCCTCIYLNT